MPGGYADAASQDAFCATTDCVVDVIFDQSANRNDLLVGMGGTQFLHLPHSPLDFMGFRNKIHEIYR